MHRYQLYEKRLIALGDDAEMVSKDYVAIPEDHIKNGIMVPASHPELFPEPAGEVDAESPEEAKALFREKMANLFG